MEDFKRQLKMDKLKLWAASNEYLEKREKKINS
jgi:hypothetical protein